MGLRYQKRNRLESFKGLPDTLLASLGTTDINYEKYDEQVIADVVNRNLDKQQEKLQKNLGET